MAPAKKTPITRIRVGNDYVTVTLRDGSMQEFSGEHIREIVKRSRDLSLKLLVPRDFIIHDLVVKEVLKIDAPEMIPYGFCRN